MRSVLISAILVLGVCIALSLINVQVSDAVLYAEMGKQSASEKKVDVDFDDVRIITRSLQCGFKGDKTYITENAGESWQDGSVEPNRCDSARYSTRTQLDNGTVRIWNSSGEYSIDGTSWQRVSAFRNVTVRDIHFMDVHFGWALGLKNTSKGRESDSILFSTFDGGESWGQIDITKINRDKQSIFAIWPQDRKNGFLVGDSVWRTTNGGRTWTNISVLLEPDSIFGIPDDIKFFDERVGLITSNQGGRYLYTSDGGQDWERRDAPRDTRFWQIIYLNDQESLAVDGSIYASLDSGKTWRKVVESDSFTSFRISDDGLLACFWGKDYSVLPIPAIFGQL